jgi:MarC family membrane protein
MLPTDWISALVLLLIVLDPVGNVMVFSSLLRQVEPARRKWVILRECGIALGVLYFFLAFGGGFLKLVGLSQSSMGIAGSIILFMIALRMVFESSEKVFGGLPQGEPFIVPMAIPMLAGPSALATVILFNTREGVSTLGAVGAITIAIAATCTVLLLGERITRLVGERGLAAMERLMGLLLTAISVEMFLRGVKEFMK